MTAIDLASHGRSAPRVKLDTLVGLRWISVAGQTAAVLVLGLVLEFPMPYGQCFAVIALSAWLNLFLKLRYPANLRLRDTPAALLLGYDVVQLAALVYFTGGLENPFSVLMLVPVIVSATTLSLRHTIALGALTVAAATLLWWLHFPLPLPPEEMPLIPQIYVGGMWVAILCTMVFTCVYAYRTAREARQLAAALGATELVLAREHHLSALDGLAAAAAHELGTPLATITLVAKELLRDARPGSQQAEDLALLVSQSQRCREILGRLSSLAGKGDDWSLGELRVTELLSELVEPHRFGPIQMIVETPIREGPEPVGRRNPAILHGLGNLIENAVEFASSEVRLTASWTPDAVVVEVSDDGPGFAAEVIDRLGEPYVTTRVRPGQADKPDTEAGGLGLGFFIAKTFLERTGARVRMENKPVPDHGAVIRLTWPRAAYGAGVCGRGGVWRCRERGL